MKFRASLMNAPSWLLAWYEQTAKAWRAEHEQYYADPANHVEVPRPEDWHGPSHPTRYVGLHDYGTSNEVWSGLTEGELRWLSPNGIWWSITRGAEGYIQLRYVGQRNSQVRFPRTILKWLYCNGCMNHVVSDHSWYVWSTAETAEADYEAFSLDSIERVLLHHQPRLYADWLVDQGRVAEGEEWAAILSLGGGPG